MAWPNGFDTFSGTAAQGTNLLTSPDHAQDHRMLGTFAGSAQHVIGLGIGTPAANFIPVGLGGGSSNWQQTWNNGTLGTPSITGGTANNQVLGTPSITGGTIAGGLVGGTANFSGGTFTSLVLVSPSSPSGSALSGALQQMVSNHTLVNGSATGTTPVVMVAGTFTTTQTANIYAQVAGYWYQQGMAQNIGTLFLNGTAITGASEIVDDFSVTLQGRTFSGAGTFSSFSGTGTISMQYSDSGNGTSSVGGARLNALVFNA